MLKISKKLEKFRSFRGDIKLALETAAELARLVPEEENILPLTPRNPADEIRWANMVRNYVALGVVKRPEKQGKKLVLDYRTLLEILLARRYLAHGVSLRQLKGKFTSLSLEELEKRLFSPQLSLKEIYEKREEESLPPQTERLARWYRLRLAKGIEILVKDDLYPPEKLARLKKALKKALREIESEN